MSHSAEAFPSVASLGVSIISVIDKVWIRTRGGESRFSVENFFLTRRKKFLREAFWSVFQKFSGSEKFMDKKGGYQGFPSKIFCLTVPKSFQGNPSAPCFGKFPVARKLIDERGGGNIKILRRYFFKAHSAEKFPRRESISVSLLSGIEKIG